MSVQCLNMSTYTGTTAVYIVLINIFKKGQKALFKRSDI